MGNARRRAATEEGVDHEIAAQFILQQQGRDPDLSTYKNPQLVTLTKPDGTEILAVFVNNDEAIIAGGGQ